MSAGSPWQREGDVWVARKQIRPMYVVRAGDCPCGSCHVRVEGTEPESDWTWLEEAEGANITDALRALRTKVDDEGRLSAWLAELADNPPRDEPTADEIVALRGEVKALTARVEALEAAERRPMTHWVAVEPGAWTRRLGDSDVRLRRMGAGTYWTAQTQTPGLMVLATGLEPGEALEDLARALPDPERSTLRRWAETLPPEIGGAS